VRAGAAALSAAWFCAAAAVAPPEDARARIGRMRVSRVGEAWGLPADAIPVDAGAGRLLFSSDSTGLWEVAAGKVVRRWSLERYGKTGEARLAPARVYAAIYGRGLAELKGTSASFTAGLLGEDLLQILVARSGDVWVAAVPLPSGRGGGVQIVRGGRAVKTIPLQGRELATLRSWIEVPERRSVFAATAGGIVELGPDARVELLSRDAVSAIARQPGGGVIGAVGTVVVRWDGSAFVPVLFRVEAGPIGSPTDVAIDAAGRWFVLYQGGVVAALDPAGAFVRAFGAGDGIPPAARRLLLDTAGRRVLIGSEGGGVVALADLDDPG